MSVSEQYENQRALARMNRSRHGADMTLDQAEIRENAMLDWLIAGKYWLPIIFTAAIGWVGMQPSISWAAGMWIVVTAVLIGRMAGRILGAIMGAFHEGIQFKAENVCFKLGGVVLCGAGAALLSPGLIVCGIALFVFPARWKRYGHNVLQNSDFARLMRAADDHGDVPRIVE